MNIPVSLVLSLLAGWLYGVCCKYFTAHFGGNASIRYLYNAVGALVASVILILWGGFGTASAFTLLLGTVFGIVTAVQQIANLKALETGPWAYTSVISSLSMLIPSLSGVLIWKERLGWLQIVGMGLMVVCLLLSVDARTGGEQRKATFRWLIFCTILFFCTGSIGVMQKWHQISEFQGEFNAFLLVAFSISFLFSSAMALILKRKQRKTSEPSVLPNHQPNGNFVWRDCALPLLLMVMGGGCAAINNKLNLSLSGMMDSAVFFPLVNGGGLILTTLSAVFLFRERLSRRQWLGLGAGISAVLLLCIG